MSRFLNSGQRRNNLGTVSPHGASTSDVPCGADYISNRTAREYWHTTWRFIARRYAGATNIAWYELASEPHLLHKVAPADGSSGPWVQCHQNKSQVRELFQEAVDNLRSVDAATPMAVAPTGYEHCPGLGAFDLLNDVAGQLIYAMNWPCSLKTKAATVSYGSSARCSDFGKASSDLPCIPACASHNDSRSVSKATFNYDKDLIIDFMAPFLEFGRRHRVPLWIDQLMCPPKLWEVGIAATWLRDSMDVADFERTHFSWWTWKGDFQDVSSQSVLTPPVGANTSASRRDLSRYVIDVAVYTLYKQAFSTALKTDDRVFDDNVGQSGGVPVKRQVRWWTNFENEPQNENAMLALIRAHPKSITGVYTYIGAGQGDSGSFSFGHSAATMNNMTWIIEKVALFSKLGISVTPALSFTNASIMSGNALKRVGAVARFAKAAGVSGMMLDFEPATSEIPWVRAYAAYVQGFTKAMHGVGLMAEMCVSDWGILDGHFLRNGTSCSGADCGYGVYAQTGVDVMMSMAGTYFGSNLTKNKHNVDLELKQGVSLSQLAVGIGSSVSPDCGPPLPRGPNAYNWTEARLDEFVGYIGGRGVAQLDIWRVDIGAETNCTEPWVLAITEKFLAGSAPQHNLAKTDDRTAGSVEVLRNGA
eukprot:SAG31_NODE_4959_length_2834_cov_2.184644_1_plen_646_part_00